MSSGNNYNIIVIFLKQSIYFLWNYKYNCSITNIIAVIIIKIEFLIVIILLYNYIVTNTKYFSLNTKIEKRCENRNEKWMILRVCLTIH